MGMKCGLREQFVRKNKPLLVIKNELQQLVELFKKTILIRKTEFVTAAKKYLNVINKQIKVKNLNNPNSTNN